MLSSIIGIALTGLLTNVQKPEFGVKKAVQDDLYIVYMSSIQCIYISHQMNFVECWRCPVDNAELKTSQYSCK